MFVICPKCGAKYKIPDEISLKTGQKMQCSACQHYFVLTSDKTQQIEKKVPKTDESFVLQNLNVEETVLPRQDLPSVAQPEIPEVFRPGPLYQDRKKTSVLLPVLMVVVSLMILCILLGLAWQYRSELQMQNNMDTLKIYRQKTVPSQKYQKPSYPRTPVIKQNEIDIPLFVDSDVSEKSMDAETTSPGVSPFSFRAVHFKVVENDFGPVVQIEGIIHNDTMNIVIVPEAVMATAYDSVGQVVFQKEIHLNRGTLAPNQEQAFFASYSPAPKEVKWIEISVVK